MGVPSASRGVALTFLLGGCAIHPQPVDVTGVPTFQIVQQIRCETRQAVIDQTLEYLTHTNEEESGVDPASREIGLRLAEDYAVDPGSIARLKPKLFKGEVNKLLSIFWTTGVAYNYTLDMTEVNKADGELDFMKTLTKGTFGFALSAGLDRTRENVRTFTVTDNFGDLVQKPIKCDNRIVGPNYVYPIAGRIGVDQMVRTFVNLSLFAHLSAPSATQGIVSSGPPTLVDALTFTTTILGDVNPQVMFSPVGRTLSVSSAHLDLNAMRTDKHEVVVGLALQSAAQAQLDFFRAGPQGQVTALMHNALFGRLLTATGNKAEIAAATAVDQFLTQKLFSPTINITP